MKRIAIAFGSGMLLVAAAAAALPWFVGQRVEEAFRADMAYLSAPARFGIDVKVVQYDRGWLSSSALTRISLRAEPQLHFDLTHDIRHGPDPRYGWALVRSTPHWASSVKPIVDQMFGGRAALSVETRSGFHGETSITLESPPFDQPIAQGAEARVKWAGLKGEIALPGDGKARIAVQAPGLSLAFPGMTADLKGLQLGGDWTMGASQLDWTGDSRFGIAEVRFSGGDGSFALTGIECAVSQRSSGDNLALAYRIKVGAGERSGAAVTSRRFSNAVAEFELDKLNKPVLARYFETVSGLDREGVRKDTRDQQVAAAALEMVQGLLKGSPELRLKNLGLQMPAGAFQANAVLGFDGRDLGPMGSPLEALQRVQFKGSAQVSRALLLTMLDEHLGTLRQRIGEMPNAAAGARAPAVASAEEQVKAWAASGLLRVDGENLVLDAEFSQGRLTINGQPGESLLSSLRAAALQPGSDRAS